MGKLTIQETVANTDYTNEGTITGTKVILQFNGIGAGHQKAETVLCEGSIKIAGRGYLMAKAGSVSGISIAYDQTVLGAGGSIEVYINRVSVFALALVNSVANNKHEFSTQARDTDSFSAGDVIHVNFIAGGTYNQVFTEVEVYIN